mgnify:CR=1 FL=1
MTENRRNILQIIPKDKTAIDFTKISRIEVYLRQGALFRQYTPTVVDAETMIVEIPFEDAMQLTPGRVTLQFAYTDEHGEPQNSRERVVPVGNLIKQEGYNP